MGESAVPKPESDSAYPKGCYILDDIVNRIYFNKADPAANAKSCGDFPCVCKCPGESCARVPLAAAGVGAGGRNDCRTRMVPRTASQAR